MTTAQDNMICAVCTEVYRSPRFLPCHHSFCLKCLEQLAARHGKVIPCPTCRAPATVPTGGVRDLQVNFYFTEEELEKARSEARPSMCPVHAKESAIFYCTQCEEAICIRCKLTKHEGHVTEDLSEAAGRCKKTIKDKQVRLEDSIQRLTTKSKVCKENEKRAREKRESEEAQIQARYGVIVAMAEKCRDQALKELQEVSDSLEKDLAADTQRVQSALDSLLHLQERVRQALSTTACDTEVLQVEKDMTQGPGSDERLRELEAELPAMTYRPGLHGDFSNNIEDEIKRYIGSPVKLTFKFRNKLEIDRIGRCCDEKCQEVYALRVKEDKTIEVLFGFAGDFSKPKEVYFKPDGSRGKETQLQRRRSYVTRKCFYWDWDLSYWRQFGSKGDSMFLILQNCRSGVCYISPMEFKTENEKQTCKVGLKLIEPKVHKVHSFDSTKCGSLFAVIDEDKEESLTKRSGEKDQGSLGNRDSRVVRLYSKTSHTPVATYVPQKQPFFPTDICFYDNDLLLIADWTNDCVHVVTVTDNSLTFKDYLSGSGDIVRPTALNLDLNGRLLIGCGDGWILKHSADISAKYAERQKKSKRRKLMI